VSPKSGVSRAPAFHPLEPRLLRAADLTVAVTGYTLPKGAQAGTALTGTATVVVTNRGPSAVAKGAPKVDVGVILRPAGTTTNFGTVVGAKKSLAVASIPKGKSVTLTIPITIGATNPGGTFSIVAIADMTRKLPETNESNNEGTARTRYTIKKTLSTLKVGNATTNLTSPGPDAKTGSAVLTNAGAVPLRGSVDVIFEARRTSPFGSTIALGRKNGVQIDLAPRGTLTVSGIPLTALPANGLAQDVTYTIVARIVPRVTPTDSVTTDNTTTAGTVTLPGQPMDNPLSLAGLGTRLTFAASLETPTHTGPLVSIEAAVNDEAGNAGTYRMRTGSALVTPELRITFPPQRSSPGFDQTYLVTSLGPTPFTFPGGRTFVFTASPNGAVARLQRPGDQTPYYLRPV
jgi:hypothetical protein